MYCLSINNTNKTHSQGNKWLVSFTRNFTKKNSKKSLPNVEKLKEGTNQTLANGVTTWSHVPLI